MRLSFSQLASDGTKDSSSGKSSFAFRFTLKIDNEQLEAATFQRRLSEEQAVFLTTV